MFADRCGRIATADLPLLFLFVGRNNILTSLTGLSYQVRPAPSLSLSARRASLTSSLVEQSLRFYHIYLGAHSTVMAIIHTFAYVGQVRPRLLPFSLVCYRRSLRVAETQDECVRPRD